MENKNRESHNARRFVWANGLQNLGDQVVSAKTVLPWAFQAAGVPHFFTALLVPFRESGSMLPQAALTPWVTTHNSRKKLWMLGSIGQAASALAIGLVIIVASGWLLGAGVLLALAALSVFRALCSIAGKDVQGRTISKGTRGQVTGRATAVGGGATLLVGIFLVLTGHLPQWALGLLVVAGSLTWAVATLVFRGIAEPVSEEEQAPPAANWWQDTWQLYAGDRRFRQFVNVRSLLLVSALSTTFIVTLAQRNGDTLLGGLGSFLLASGVASLVGGRVSGVFSDRSSRNVMAGGAAVASVVLVLIVAADAALPAAVNQWLLPAGFFVVTLAHTSIRVARKTYVVDMAEGDQRTRYVGAANTMMGVMLLVVGGISALIALAGPSPALLFLALVGAVGVWRARQLEDVSS